MWISAGVRFRRVAGVALVIAAIMAIGGSAAAQEPAEYKGRLLINVLRALQAKGLRIVFSSATVTPDLRVQVEPRATTARRQLDELLAPHGLEARGGPGATIQIVRGKVAAKKPRAAANGIEEPSDNAFPISRASAAYREYVSVIGETPYRRDRGVPSETRVDRSQLERLYGSLSDDPIRVAHTLPGATAVDEFRSEFAVRGSPFRHVNLVIDGVSTQWLQHTAHRRGATGSLPMLAAPVVEDVTLRAGAYPRREGDRLGPQLDLTLREGSRTGFGLRGAIGGTNATLLGEGPLGRAARGSWLVAARQSYLEWPAEHPQSTRTAFGFSDGLAKVVYDVGPGQQVALTVLGGMSNVDGDDQVVANEMGNGTNRASVVNLSWRSTFGSAVVLNQRAYIVRQDFLNKYQSGSDRDRGANEEVVYRADITRRTRHGLLEGGAQLGRTTVADVPLSAATQTIAGSSGQRSGYVHFAWAATPTFTLSPGVRVTGSTLLPRPIATSWLLGEWAFRSGWRLNGSAGVSQQPPELRHVLSERGSLEPRPERARHLDLSIEQRLANSIRWRATIFDRHEDDILREPDIYPKLIGDALAFPERERYTNALQGTSRGIEILVERRRPVGLSGWAAYSYGETRYTDTARRETYWSDFDQRHALNLFGAYRFSARTTVGGTFRAGTSFPIPGYFARRDGRLVVASIRNDVRLPTYARLDLRADRRFNRFGRRFTLFAEVLNAFNHTRVDIVAGSVNPGTGEATGFTDALARRRASAGIVFEF